MEIKEEGDREGSLMLWKGWGWRGRGGGGGRVEIEKVVLLQTVTESESLSCCQEKNTEAHINSTFTLFLFALHLLVLHTPPSFSPCRGCMFRPFLRV